MPSSVFSIGLLASSEPEITPKHLHRGRVLSYMKTLLSASLVDMNIDSAIRELTLRSSFAPGVNDNITQFPF
jgi:hypothetical protein